ncbi:hypothetical protein FKM82_023037 [Ascaphus truei]
MSFCLFLSFVFVFPSQSSVLGLPTPAPPVSPSAHVYIHYCPLPLAIAVCAPASAGVPAFISLSPHLEGFRYCCEGVCGRSRGVSVSRGVCRAPKRCPQGTRPQEYPREGCQRGT